MSGNYASFRDYLMQMALEVGLGSEDFRPLPDGPAAEVVSALKGRFGDSVELMWWRADAPCDLPVASRRSLENNGFEWIDRLAPDAGSPAWLVVEDRRGHASRCFVFESRPAAIRQVLGNAHGFEYLVASRRLDWLLVENDHSVMTAVGGPVVERLMSLDGEPLAEGWAPE